jgi:hypothetical protein
VSLKGEWEHYIAGIILETQTRTMLGGSLVTTVWRVLRLRMEEAPYSFGGQLRIY